MEKFLLLLWENAWHKTLHKQSHYLKNVPICVYSERLETNSIFSTGFSRLRCFEWLLFHSLFIFVFSKPSPNEYLLPFSTQFNFFVRIITYV